MVQTMRPVTKAVYTLIKDGSLKTGIFDKKMFSVYPFQFSPRQLIFLTECVERTAQVPGCYAEVGCNRGYTSAFLKRFMEESGIEKDYYAVDTFSGFISDHVDHEVKERGKSESIRFKMADNKKSWFDRSMEVTGIKSLTSIQADAATFDYASLGPIAFCLLDVDLYVPIAKALPGIYENLSPGGIIVVDDCAPDQAWDGALQAYDEFVKSMNLPSDVRHEKLGVIEKSAAA
ncbi:MAG TPA: TylF/MycF/NovP-related O-methyltransferase [Alphaproteobacteria bacterium]|nr:TylF/MycF/NovP-related O-methyltransferase [Alphaproteobacteria bacterium]